MRNVTITINATISIKVNDDAKAKHHHDNKSRQRHTTKMLPNSTGRVIKANPSKVNHSEDEIFFVTDDNRREFVRSRKLFILDGEMFAFDIATLKGIKGGFANTSYGTIKPDGEGGLKQFSNKHGRWYPCSVQNGIYTIENVMDDVRKYDL